MSSSGGEIGSTLTGGIQDVAAILPLLGTEQCSEQVSSALTRGYLYAASAPMSIFGSLGVVIAGFKTFVACFSFGDIEGAKILENMGFEPQGENLSLIMVKAGEEKNTKRYIIETRIEELIKELNIDETHITKVFHKSTAWNIKMMATTALLCAFGITPYIYLNSGANNLKKSTRWVFPVLRATGGFITATLIQLLIQRRITTLSEKYLVKRNEQHTSTDEETGDMKKCQMIVRRIAPTWLLLCVLLIGLVASLVGYIGCFSVVQNSTSSFGPVSWLCLEAGLSVVRLAIWGSNPTWDDAPPLEIVIELDKYKHDPLPTCNKDNAEILEYKVLPLTRARDFLKMITSFAGLIESFNNPDLSLYYTLTRKRPSKKSVPADGETNYSDRDNEPELESDYESVRANELERDNEPEDADEHKLGERVLYITVFDHKERTTRVYARDDEGDTFYSTTMDGPLVDVGHFLLEVEIDAKIDPKGDPVSSDINTLDSLRNHHRTILEHIQYRLGAGDAVTNPYAIENSWTMKLEDTISTFRRLRKENGDDWKAFVEKGKEKERNEESLPICGYFTHASIERERRLLDEKRTKWKARRMEMITKETKERLQPEEVEYRVNKQAVEKKPAAYSIWDIQDNENLLFRERFLMEELLLWEVKEWELHFWNKMKAFLDQIGIDRVEEKERLTREWRANCWKRLNPQMHAAEKRGTESDDIGIYMTAEFQESLSKAWASSISQLFEGVEKSGSISLSKLRGRNISNDPRTKVLEDEIHIRMENEMEDIEFRLKRGSDLRRFDQFWDDDSLFECRYSRSKWLYLEQDSTIPLEIYSHALKGNKNITHITFSAYSYVKRFQATICGLPRVTSISKDWIYDETPTNIHRDLLFIKSTNNDLITFAKEIRLKLDPFSTYIFTDVSAYDLDSGRLKGVARVLISFVAPTSGQSLVLKLKHSGSEDALLEVTLGSTIIQLYPSSKSLPTIDDITLHPIQDPSTSESDYPGISFERGVRNDIIIDFRRTAKVPEGRHGHFLHDVELLDESGLEYYPRNRIINVD